MTGRSPAARPEVPVTIPDLPSTARLAVRETGFLVRPIPVFIALSLLFGIALVAVSPPLRGPDETAHFCAPTASRRASSSPRRKTATAVRA